MKGWGTKSKWVLLYCSALFVKYKFNSDYVNQNLNFAVLLNAANQFEWTKKMMFFFAYLQHCTNAKCCSLTKQFSLLNIFK